MIFRQDVLAGIRDGRITVAFRRWRRPTVRSGGTLLTAAGQLHIRSLERVAIDRITGDDARHAGFPSRAALVDELNERKDGEVYRIELGALTADPRVALRESRVPSANELDALLQRLDRLDRRASGPWTSQVLQLIAEHPGVRAADLSVRVGQEKDDFKTNVRKLKALGLTESLEVGYRLSPRGRQVLQVLLK